MKAAVKPEQERKTAPEFALKDEDGKTVKLSDYKGKVVLLNFWATWCGPCKIEIPWFMDFEQTYKDKNFAVLGVSLDEDGWDAVKPYIKEKKINYRVMIGTEAVAPAIRWSQNGRLVAVASRRSDQAAQKAHETGAERGYAPYDAMLSDPEVDAVYIGLPNGLHEEWALRCAEAGKHVLCDKSLTLTLDSARRMAAAIRRIRRERGERQRLCWAWPCHGILLSTRITRAAVIASSASAAASAAWRARTLRVR